MSIFKDKKAIFIFVFPAFILFTVMVVSPIFTSIYYSFLDWDGVREAKFIGLSNYKELFTSGNLGFIKAIFNSLKIAFASTFVQVPLGFVLALMLSKDIRFKKFFRTVYFIPFVLSAVVIGQLWMKIYHPKYGMLNQLLELIGLDSLKGMWLADPKSAMVCVIVPIVFQYSGYYMLLCYAAINSIPESVLEAAYLEGSSGIKHVIHIIIPLILPMLKVCFTFAVIGSMKVFDMIYIMTNGGPLHATEVPSTLLIQTIFIRNRYSLGSTIGIFIFLECMIFTLSIQKIFRKADIIKF